MQCGVETMNDCERSPGRTGLRVNFTEKGEVKERREKFLTAKYGTHQMSLIRKRLAVEMWLYDELQKLFDPPVSNYVLIIKILRFIYFTAATVAIITILISHEFPHLQPTFVYFCIPLTLFSPSSLK